MAVAAACLDAAAVLVALVAMASGLNKLLEPARTIGAVAGLGRVRRPAATVLWAAVTTLELAGGLALLLVAEVRDDLAFTFAMLWFVYAWLQLRAVRGGGDVADCGCTFGRRVRPSNRTVMKPFVLGLIAASAASGAEMNGSGGIPVLTWLAAVVFLVLYLAADQLSTLPRLERRT